MITVKKSNKDKADVVASCMLFGKNDEEQQK
jgi:hypothetical protein